MKRPRWWRRRTAAPSQEAQAAAYAAGRSLLDAQNLDARVSDIADQLAQTRARNHFGAAVAASMRGRST
jgi:hypothetical protein